MSASWVVLVGPQRRLECRRCGERALFDMPIEVNALVSLSDGFVKRHRRCTLKPDGLHCLQCGKTGHETEDCVVRTPEEWLAGSDTGVSSQTIYGAVYDAKGYARDGLGEPWFRVPSDRGDFGRCHRLLVRFGWRSKLDDVVKTHPDWSPIVQAWDELTAVYERSQDEDSVVREKAIRDFDCLIRAL